MLRKPNESLFGNTPNINTENLHNTVVKLPIDKLEHYHDHPFKLYHGQRLADMVQSIQELGIINPILARPVVDDIHEILAGHNRFEAAKLAGLTEVPVIVMKDLTDDEAELIVTESNFAQRGFSDMLHSERAAAIHIHYSLIKKQGKRTDLLKKVDHLLSGVEGADLADETADVVDENKPTNELVGERYGLSPRSISRYLLLHELTDDFKTLLDADELSIRAGCEIAHIGSYGQNLIHDRLEAHNLTLSMKQASSLRLLSEEYDDKKLPKDIVDDILLGRTDIVKSAKPKPVTVKFKPEVFSTFFEEDTTEDQMADTIKIALEHYYKHVKPNEPATDEQGMEGQVTADEAFK